MSKVTRRSLGRGLDALIPDRVTGGSQEITRIAISDISLNPYQPRKAFSEESLSELIQSVKEHGIVQPLIVRPEGTGYQLVAGERRLRAAQSVGLVEVPVLIRDVSDADALQIALIENLQREDLNPMEEAEAFHRLSEDFGLTQEQIASRVGKSRPQVSNTMRLVQLEPSVRELVRQGRISAGHAKVLLGIENSAVQCRVAQQIIEKHLSVRQTEELVAGLGERTLRSKKAPQSKKPDALVKGLEDRLRLELGTIVKIKGETSRGSIEIKYYNEDDLERLVKLLLGEGVFEDRVG